MVFECHGVPGNGYVIKALKVLLDVIDYPCHACLVLAPTGQYSTLQETSMVSCQKGPTRHAYAWPIGPFWQDTLDIHLLCASYYFVAIVVLGGVISHLSISTRGPFYQHRLTLIPTWISNYICYQMRDEISYPFPKFNGCTVEIWKWMSNLIIRFTGHVITYLC